MGSPRRLVILAATVTAASFVLPSASAAEPAQESSADRGRAVNHAHRVWTAGGTTTIQAHEVQEIPEYRWVTSDIALPGDASPESVTVSVDIAHASPSHLRVLLVAPDGVEHTLYDGDDAEAATGVRGAWTVNAPSSPTGEPWSLHMYDAKYGDRGVLNQWSIAFPHEA